MPDSSTLTLFLAAALALLLTPGPAVLYIVTRSVDQGRAAGIVSALGLGVGNMFHVAAAALGLSALLASSAMAFGLVKYAGAAYLIYLGLRKLLARGAQGHTEVAGRRKLSGIFGQGVVVNLLNPKTALFFLAFLPQFVNPAAGSLSAQILALGSLFVVLGVLSDTCYALLASVVRRWLKGSAKFVRAERYFAGSVYLGLGLATALSAPARNK